VPKVWSETIETHRRMVRDAILDTTAALVAQHGLLWVTMSQIAESVGIGRATLYKYFPDVESILVAWHDRQVAGHLEHLIEVRDRSSDPEQRLKAVLEVLAHIHHQHHGSELAGVLHRGGHVAQATQHIKDFLKDVLVDGVTAGDVRSDIAPEELANYCFYALTSAAALPSKAATKRLVNVILTGLRPVG
jgi:AcrR family transcriptional regulator